MSGKLIIVMANTDPRNGEELGAPIFQATVAAAMEYEVDVICTATSGRLMKKGVAQGLDVAVDVRDEADGRWHMGAPTHREPDGCRPFARAGFRRLLRSETGRTRVFMVMAP